MASPVSIAVLIELVIEDGSIRGVVRHSHRRETPFWGWLDLISAVEACRRECQDDPPATMGTEGLG